MEKCFFGAGNGNYYALDAERGRKLWNYTIKGYGQIEGSPAYAAGIIYAPSHDGVLYALNAETGTKVWSYDASGISRYGATSVGSPAVANGVVVVGSENGTVYAFGQAMAPAPAHDIRL